MPRVSKKTLGKRRRRWAMLLIVVIVLLIWMLTRCSGKDVAETMDETAATTETSETAETTAPMTTATTATTATTTTTTTTTTELVYLDELPDEAQVDVTPILQNPELPTGCEVTSLTMALQFLGYDIDKLTLADDYLICADPYEATFGEAFIGTPYSENSWGCYAPVIVKTAENYLADQGGEETVYDLTGTDFEDLFWYVAEGSPVIVWASIGMTTEIEEKYYWTTPEGKDAVFLTSEHCLVLCGYDLDAQTVTVCDPLVGKTDYLLSVFEDRYNKMYQQAILIR